MKVQIAVPKFSFICLILVSSTGCGLDCLPVWKRSKSVEDCQDPVSQRAAKTTTGPTAANTLFNSSEVVEPEEVTVCLPEEADQDNRHNDHTNYGDSRDANDVAHTKPVSLSIRQMHSNSSDTPQTKAKQRSSLKPVAEQGETRNIGQHPEAKAVHIAPKSTASSTEPKAEEDSENRSSHTTEGSSGAPRNTINLGRSNSDIDPKRLNQDQQEKENNPNSSNRVASESNLPTSPSNKGQKKDSGNNKKIITPKKIINGVSRFFYEKT